MEMQNVLIKLHHENTRNIVVLKVVNILKNFGVLILKMLIFG